MLSALPILFGVAALVGLVCQIWVVVKMFGQSILTGILGLICSLYALIWGWQNREAAGLETVMIVWLVTVAAMIGLRVALMVMAASGVPVVPVMP